MGTECSEGMRRYTTLGLLAASALLLAACGGGGGDGSMTQMGQSADTTTDGKSGSCRWTAVPKAACGPTTTPNQGFKAKFPSSCARGEAFRASTATSSS